MGKRKSAIKMGTGSIIKFFVVGNFTFWEEYGFVAEGGALRFDNFAHKKLLLPAAENCCQLLEMTIAAPPQRRLRIYLTSITLNLQLLTSREKP